MLTTSLSLLQRLGQPGERGAWDRFVELYTPLVYGYARKQGLQDADAADLSQDVLGAVAGAVGRLEYDPARGAFRNWLFTVVRRKLANWRRAQRSRPDGTALLPSPAAPAAPPELPRRNSCAASAFFCCSLNSACYTGQNSTCNRVGGEAP